MENSFNNPENSDSASSLGFTAAYILHLADNSLIMGHRLSEWTGHGPMLEQDIAISNIALDLIGQARNFYQYAAAIINAADLADRQKALSLENKSAEVTEDTLAYLRDVRQFRNLLITEIPNGDWAKTVLKLFLFSTYQYYLYRKLVNSSDKQLSAIAEKSLKEVTYHVRWSSEWVTRLGDGTEESNRRIKTALEEIWSFAGEMFEPVEFETLASKHHIGVTVSELEDDWTAHIKEVFTKATLAYPIREKNTWIQTGGKNGIHSEHLGFILAEMQFLQRAYPGCKW